MLVNFWRVVDSKGGTEKIFCNMANEFSSRGHEIMAVYCEKKEGVPFFPLSNSVLLKNVGYDLMHKTIFYKIKREILRIISKKICYEVSEKENEKHTKFPLKLLLEEFVPDVIVAFQPVVTNILINALKTSIPVITMFHLQPKQLLINATQNEIFALDNSECVQVLMPSFENELKKYCNPRKIVVIPNIVPQFSREVTLLENKKYYKIIMIGRLDKKQKRPHLLIEIFKKLGKRFLDWELDIWGEIVDEKYYKKMLKLVYKYNMSQRVHFNGTSNDIVSVLRNADILAILSPSEGFPLSLTEAMSIGIPSVGFDYCSGVNELIKNGYNGFLCSDSNDMEEKLTLLMNSYELRKKMGKNAHLSMKKYSEKIIWDQWEKLFFITNANAKKANQVNFVN